MPKSKYKFNPETLRYEKIQHSFRKKLSRFLTHFFSVLSVSVLLLIFISQFFDTPKEQRLKREINQMKSNYEMMEKKMDQVYLVLNEIQYRDDNIYRVIFEADPIPSSIRDAGFGGMNRYKDLEGFETSDLVIANAKKLDIILNKMYVQSKSYDDVFKMAKNKEKMLSSIPSIRPIAVDQISYISSYFSRRRMHPILKIVRPHEGMDFTAPRGTEVHATGDGVVADIKINRSKFNYGTWIKIDHGFSYETFYAHLDKVLVKKGQKVLRGDVIGLVGNTGLSHGPHLHYEVRKNNRAIDPINYYFKDISPDEYQKMIEYSKLGGQSMD